ncbi:PREDICTED: cell division control protein 6 homolog [Ceratosolen solmsi marchali]|uniref:Cell division control protein n=1 Tax=Ceratosolen solmsi marchali TaxID=326594 RepID=A0AAJ6YWC3_9HYME|nr:PREDICTED: cell division control protein 6 homolog [Ceratosolen solmsi marchali]
MSVQTTIPFRIRKKNFYSSKDNTPKIDFSNASLRSTPTTRYTPTVKKMVDISSESESNSDEENIGTNNNNIRKTPKRTRRKSNGKDETGSTPPKQIKSISPITPCNLLNQLSLLSPTTKQDKLAPKKLFNNNKYSEARKALHGSLPDNLIGREVELTKLEDFLQDHLDKRSSSSLYVSGLPGTGKTASLSNIISKSKFKNAFKIIYVNCTTMKSASTIYSKIIEELNLNNQRPIKNKKDTIEKYLTQPHKMLLLVLDEMDQLETKNQSVLYSIFEWPSIPQSKLVLVGIANALDLTDRILPRLQSRCELKPNLLHFKPYSKQQIMDILTQRLKEANVLDVFSDTAMQFLAGKVAAISGDIRRALDIGRRIVEIAESQKMMQILQPTNENDNIKKGQVSDEENRVDFKDVRIILNRVYGGSQNADNEEHSFPIQQKILLCSLMLILNKGKHKDINIGRLYQVYRKVCKPRKIVAVDMSEFVCLCTLIETRGIIKLIMKKEARLSKVSLQWDQEVLTAALQDKDLTSDIINDISCL